MLARRLSFRARARAATDGVLLVLLLVLFVIPFVAFDASVLADADANSDGNNIDAGGVLPIDDSFGMTDPLALGDGISNPGDCTFSYEDHWASCR